MSIDNSDIEGAAQANERLASAGRKLVHDVATPLATLQLNLQVLLTYLPTLIKREQESAGAASEISPEHLQALASLPGALDADIGKIRHAVQLFSSVLAPGGAGPTAAEVPLPPPRSPLRVLLVEDEEIHQEIALKQLAGRGRVDIAATGREALERVAQADYDLVLMDLMLSGQDARGLVGQLRAQGGDATRVILVSNMPLSPDEVRQAQADGVLEKPFRFASLVALLQRLTAEPL